MTNIVRDISFSQACQSAWMNNVSLVQGAPDLVLPEYMKFSAGEFTTPQAADFRYVGNKIVFNVDSYTIRIQKNKSIIYWYIENYGEIQIAGISSEFNISRDNIMNLMLILDRDEPAAYIREKLLEIIHSHERQDKVLLSSDNLKKLYS